MKPIYSGLLFLMMISNAAAQSTLYIPPVLNGPIYNLNMQLGSHQFNPGKVSATKGFNGNVLGPTLIMQKGQQVYMNVKNSIGEETTVHWHGFHVGPENDGGPHTVIEPNTTWTPNFPVLERAGTYWYHPHAHLLTAKHVLQGLAGMIIVKDPQEAALALPRTYGVDDFPLIIQSKAIDADGLIIFESNQTNRDTTVTVNASKNPLLQVPQQMVRFRILNGSNQRVFNIGLSNNSVFYHIATDGGLKANRTALTRLKLAPGERGEIVIPFTAFSVGSNVTLRSYGNELPNGAWGAVRPWINNQVPLPNYPTGGINGNAYTLMRFTVVAATANPVTSIPPATLVPVVPIPEAQATVTRSKWLFSGNQQGVRIGSSSNLAATTPYDLGVVNDVIPLDQTEIWTIHGAHDQYHPFHIHDIQFYILDRRDSNNNIIPLTSNDIGRKDVVYVGPKETVRFITKFDDFFSDIPYMYHCHITFHEDMGMMKQFTVNRRMYVDKDYTGTTETGSIFFPFKTLKAALTAADEGTTIYILSAGLHEEIASSSILTSKKVTILPTNGSVTFQ
ncbi:MAG: bilirubin oxidase [Chitinophagaceae bacterium]|nr:MAG: bilirubin oxidase [Chitinophagaceae bacterium]